MNKTNKKLTLHHLVDFGFANLTFNEKSVLPAYTCATSDHVTLYTNTTVALWYGGHWWFCKGLAITGGCYNSKLSFLSFVVAVIKREGKKTSWNYMHVDICQN